MKVILHEKIAKLGNKYEIKNVADGYALNYLLPEGLAEFADEEAIQNTEQKRKEEQKHQKEYEDKLARDISRLEGERVKLVKRANDQGHLFAGVHPEGLEKAIEEQVDFKIPAEYIQLGSALKDVGEHQVDVRVGEHTASVTITVSSEEDESSQEKAEEDHGVEEEKEAQEPKEGDEERDADNSDKESVEKEEEGKE